MKHITSKFIILCFILTAFSCKNEKAAESTDDHPNMISTAQFKVWGNCEMCKETIEGSLKVEGISKAEWNTETKEIQVTYDSTKITLDQIQKNIAAAGYDNEKYKSDDKAYHSLPECCQYERQ